jgi:hypothetical protein
MPEIPNAPRIELAKSLVLLEMFVSRPGPASMNPPNP